MLFLILGMALLFIGCFPWPGMGARGHIAVLCVSPPALAFSFYYWRMKVIKAQKKKRGKITSGKAARRRMNPLAGLPPVRK